MAGGSGQLNVGALIITYTILGDPYYSFCVLYPKVVIVKAPSTAS